MLTQKDGICYILWINSYFTVLTLWLGFCDKILNSRYQMPIKVHKTCFYPVWCVYVIVMEVLLWQIGGKQKGSVKKIKKQV